MTRPEFITYCHDDLTISAAIHAGLRTLILEDPTFSLRSDAVTLPSQPLFSGFKALAEKARLLCPDVILWATCDCVLHNSDFLNLPLFIIALQEAKISTLLIQDFGLIDYFHQHFPSATLVFFPDMSVLNLESISYFSHYCAGHVLGNELPLSDLSLITHSLPHVQFLLQVQGPLLIQYSYRRYLEGRFMTDSPYLDQTRLLAQDRQYSGRHFTFHDTPHGHFMFATFDRCLLKYIPDLMGLNLSYWIMDSRGESMDYFSTVLSVYREACDAYLDSPDAYIFNPLWMKRLESVSRRPQKAGFFRANQTDQIREKHHIQSDLGEWVGTVVDVQSEKRITLHLEADIRVGDVLVLRSPRKKECQIVLSTLWSVDQLPLLDSSGHVLVQIPWIPSCDSKARFYRPHESAS